METIDGKWIKARLTGRHGEKAELARHMQIETDRLSKILAGKRAVRPEEVPRLLSYFNERIVPADHPDVDKADLLARLDRLNTAGRRMMLRQLEVALSTPEFVRPNQEPPTDD